MSGTDSPEVLSPQHCKSEIIFDRSVTDAGPTFRRGSSASSTRGRGSREQTLDQFPLVGTVNQWENMGSWPPEI